MKTPSTCLVILAASLAVLMGQATALCTVEVKSPDGHVLLTLNVDTFEGASGSPTFSVSYKGRSLIAPSRMGFELRNAPLKQRLRIVSQTGSRADTTWKPVYGERSIIRDHYQEAAVELQEQEAPYRRLHLTLRAYNEGAAFCYTVPKQAQEGSVTVARELTEFRLSDDYPAWATYTAQGVYSNVPISQIRRGCERPLVIRVADDLYLALAEARCVDYARTKFAPLAGQPHSLVTDLGSEVTSSLPLRTPWRVVMVGDSPGQLLERNDLLLNLNDPCALADPSWVKPGKVIREVTLSTRGGKACVDFAVRHQLQYIEFDAGWYGPEGSDASDARVVSVNSNRPQGGLDLTEVIRYAADRGVGVILYVNRRELERRLDELLPFYRQWGVKGLKYGFVNVGSQKWTAWLHDAMSKTAGYQLMVDVHDEYRPTGWSRTYPNLVTQEGIRGDEEKQPNRLNLVTVFTRMLAGAGDHTICYYDERVDRQSTHAYQLAKAVCLYSPWQFLYWYDRPFLSREVTGRGPEANNVLGEEPELEFFDHCPTVWDDTKVLRGSIGEYAVIARRSGENWFIGAMNSDTPRRFDTPLTFLDPGRTYVSHIYSDEPSAPTRTHVKIGRFSVNRDTVLKVTMPVQGGQAIRLVPATATDEQLPYRP
jgi:alpha-glucosidase